jgi:beta-fructofuranosidase
MRDPAFPALHIRPARGWLNDPNGLCRIDGRYHVFFQYNPHAPVHGNVHWGHVSSNDLLHWTEHEIALAPRPAGIDAAGCWSGCVVDDGGVPTAVYTANPDHAGNATVGLARSDRTLETWIQADESVVPAPADPAIADVRDPFVFTFEGHRYAVQGAGKAGGRPQLLLWRCDDLDHWDALGPLLTVDDAVAAEVAPADIWECPNLAEVDGHWVVLLSVWRWVDGTHLLDGVRYLLGDLVSEGDGLRFTATSGGRLDDGPAFYAPQLMNVDGRTLLWGWSWELGRLADLPPRAVRRRRPAGQPAGDGAGGAAPGTAGAPRRRRAVRAGVRGGRPGTGRARAGRRPRGRAGGVDVRLSGPARPHPGRRQHGRGLRPAPVDHDPGLPDRVQSVAGPW